MQNMTDLTWSEGAESITLSPRYGGRIISWRHAGAERVHPPVHYEGGLFRVLFAEEQYPGASYVVPHQVVDWRSDADGFRAHLRHYWSTPGWFMRAAGWPEKANEFHIDELLLDKVFTYHREQNCLVCDLTLTNLSDETKYLTPWIHSSFAPWSSERWVTINGERQEYRDTEIYWGAHLVPPHTTASVVQGDAGGKLFAVLGAATDHLRGLCGMLPIKGEFHQAASELRGAALELAPGSQFRANYFLAFTADWQRVARTPPVALHSEIAPAPEKIAPLQLADLLHYWMLPAERERGLMALSFLDKPPFYAEARYAAAHSFAGFYADGNAARGRVMLYAGRDLTLRAELSGGDGEWQLGFADQPAARQLDIVLRAHDYLPLTLQAPLDLRGRETVSVTLTTADREPLVLRVAPEAKVEGRHSYQARQAPASMELRYRDKLGPAPDADPAAIREWQQKMRARLRQWLEFNAYGSCDLDPRLLERQEGPTCIREKWVVQTEPGIHIPGYLVRPKNAAGRLPLVYFLHGSGPGKDGFAGDELLSPQRTMFGHELENMPYSLAARLGCLVYVPDGRGQGELGETDPGRWSARLDALGVSNAALRLWDQMRALDWLVQRDDVDAARIGSCGCSGGGGMTYMFAAADERVTASIVSSTSAPRPVPPAPPGWFHRMLLESGARIEPYGVQPISGAPMGMLIAPRPLWIVDGCDDLDVPRDRRGEWRDIMQRGRDEIRRVYERLGAPAQFTDSWIEGGHCAGMTHDNVVAWFGQWFKP
jgi:dienelactone hydrolase